jgi:ubiquinone/menaquinone biosynthesis C-methylase UbiE
MSGARDVEDAVARHYGRGTLLQLIQEGLRKLGRADGAISPDDLAGVDEFHMGGRQATEQLALSLVPTAHMHLLDIGCGIGGPARYFAHRFGCRVTGIDLTPEFVATAEALTRMTGLAGRVTFRQASASRLPFEPRSFEAAMLVHVGMNIPDKQAVFVQAARVLKPGGRFIVYDAMRLAPGELVFPLPWARLPENSFLAGRDEYRDGLESAGFEITEDENLAALAIEVFRQVRERMAAPEGPPPLNLPMLIGPEAPIMLANLMRTLDAGILAPVRMTCRRA